MSESYTESWLSGPKDCQFYTRTYKADEPKAVVVFVHGFIEHIGRYEHVHRVFRDRGISVFCYDQRGFGRTALDEKRSKDSVYGRTSWKDQAADIEWAVKHVRGEFGDIPTFLVGHSMVRSPHIRLCSITYPLPGWCARTCIPDTRRRTARQLDGRSSLGGHLVESSDQCDPSSQQDQDLDWWQAQQYIPVHEHPS
jgi:hypothetical protein